MTAVILLGPTASGKTALLEVAYDGGFEVVVADALQAYRGMDIGTAKPPAQLRARIPHHLLDILDPDQPYSCGDFVRRAEAALVEIASRGHVPVISGGSAYYLRNLIYGLPESPVGDPVVRDTLREEARSRGFAALHQELLRVDPEAGRAIHPGDTYRILRALEIHRVSGLPRSAFAPPQVPRADLEFRILGVRTERAELRNRIRERVDQMFRLGLPSEVRGLMERGYGPAAPGMRAIGYREFFRMQAGCLTMGGVSDLIIRDTAHYAKRQETFFRSLPGITWMGRDEAGVLARALAEAGR